MSSRPTPITMAKRILLVDDNPAIRRIVRSYLEKQGLVVCGEAGDGQEAIDQLPRLNPDLVVLDFSMPRMNGLDAARQLKFQNPGLPIVMLTLHKDEFMASQAANAGIDAVVAKSDNLSFLFEQINRF